MKASYAPGRILATVSILLISSVSINAQVGIGTTNIDNGVALEIESSDSGVLIPRIALINDTDNTTISGALTNGTLIYNTNNNATLDEGFYFWQTSRWVIISDVNLGKDDLTQLAEDRTYDMNANQLNFRNGNFGINSNANSRVFDAISDENVDSFKFTQENGLTGEKDVFTIEDQDTGGGGQDESSVLKIHKSGAINAGDNGFSLIELANTGIDPGANKYWITGRKINEGAPLWGVDITDNDIWTEGGLLIGTTGADGGTYSGGDAIIESDGNAGFGTISPGARLQVEQAASDTATEDSMVIFRTATDRDLTLLQPDTSDNDDPFTFQTNNALEFRVDATDALTIDSGAEVGINQNNPQANLHIGGTGTTVRVDALNSTNNTNNNGIDNSVVHVNANGELILTPRVDDFPIDASEADTFLSTPITIQDPLGTTIGVIAHSETITLTRETLVEVSFWTGCSIGAYGTIATNEGILPTDGKPRIYGGYVTSGTTDIVYNASSWTNGIMHNDNYTSTGDVSTGFFTVGGNGFINLPAGTHTIELILFAGGGAAVLGDSSGLPRTAEGYEITFGSNAFNRFQLVYHN